MAKESSKFAVKPAADGKGVVATFERSCGHSDQLYFAAAKYVKDNGHDKCLVCRSADSLGKDLQK